MTRPSNRGPVQVSVWTMLALRDERWVAEKRDQWNCIKHNTLITDFCSLDTDKSDHVLFMTDICKRVHYVYVTTKTVFVDLEDLIENVAGSDNLDSYSLIFCKPCPLLCEYSILKVLNAQWKIGDLLYSVAIVIGSLSAFEKQKEHSFKLLYGIVSLLWTDCCKSGLRRLSLKVEETKVLSWFSSAFVSKKAKGVVWRSQGNGGSRGEFKGKGNTQWLHGMRISTASDDSLRGRRKNSEDGEDRLREALKDSSTSSLLFIVLKPKFRANGQVRRILLFICLQVQLNYASAIIAFTFLKRVA
ncbi:hypothetical protein NC651_009568 [Populus alba x Populus x berolinensis]|nr:hypothetical protein NC651_009568 [Populus alba x Populus x berolinensis]